MDVVTVPSRCGSMVVDFDAKNIRLNRHGVMAKGAGLTDMMIRFEDITHVELSRPTFSKLGICCFILNGTRYVVPGGGMDATNFNVAKRDFPLLENTLKRVMSVCGIADFTEPNSISFPTVVYSGGIVSGGTQNHANTGSSLSATTAYNPAAGGNANPVLANAVSTPYRPPTTTPTQGFFIIIGTFLCVVGTLIFTIGYFFMRDKLNLVMPQVGSGAFVVGLIMAILGRSKVSLKTPGKLLKETPRWMIILLVIAMLVFFGQYSRTTDSGSSSSDGRTAICNNCHGTGRKNGDTCIWCNGSGRTYDNKFNDYLK